MDAETFKQRLLPLSRQLYWTAYRLTGERSEAEDLVQEVYARLWTLREKLPPDMNDLPYCLRTLRNVFLNMQRAQHIETDDADDETLGNIADDDTPDTLTEQRELSGIVLKLVENLPEQQRRVMTMKDVDDCSIDEIAAHTGLAPGNIRVILSRARKTVRQELKKMLAIRKNTYYSHDE